MTGREVPRSVQALIVRDLARNHQQLIMRVQDAIKPHLHLTLNQVRLVLDAIEAA